MIKQIAFVTLMNLKTLPKRYIPALVIVVGMACVVGVMLSMMSFAGGYVAAFSSAGDPGRAIVFSLAAQSEATSNVPRNVFPTIVDMPGIAKDAAGKPLAEAEVLVNVPMSLKANGTDTNMTLRGVGPQSIGLRPKFKLVAGRMYRRGARELIVGRAAQGQFANTNIGDKVILPDGQWPIVGVFTTGDITEGTFFADRDTVMEANRKKNYNSVLIRLTSPAAFDTFRNAVNANPTLSVSVERHSAYYVRSTSLVRGVFDGIAYLVGGIMAIGALFGALNTMYAAVSTRTREIATLRALGFSSIAVAASVLFEALLLALSGAMIGAAIAWLCFDGKQKAAGPSVFNLLVTPQSIEIGIVLAVIVGIVGGIFPSVRAARRSIAEAVRAT